MNIPNRNERYETFINSTMSNCFLTCWKATGIASGLVTGFILKDLGCNGLVTALASYEVYVITTNMMSENTVFDSIDNPFNGSICQIAYKWLKPRNNAELPLPAVMNPHN